MTNLRYRRNILLFSSILIGIIAFYWPERVEAENLTFKDPASLLVQEIQIRGLKRTKSLVLKPYTDALLGKPFTSKEQEQLIQNLRSLGLFHSIQANTLPNGNGGAVLQIEVKEKWTLVPLPVGGASSGGSLYGGLLLFESNLFGYNKKFFGGVILSESAWKVMTGYIDPKLFQTNHAFFLGFNGGIDQQEYRSASGNLNHRFEKTSFDVLSEVTFPLGGKFSLGIGLQFQEQQVNPSYEGAFNSPESGRFLSPSLGIRYQNIYYGSVLMYGTSGNIRYEQGWNLSEDSIYNRTALFLQTYLPISQKHRGGLSLVGQTMLEGPPVLYRKVSGRFLKTLPENLYSDTIIAAQLSMEGIPLTFSWGAPTVVLFYEAGGYRREETSSFLWTHGPGAGFRIYLAKVAVPAFGFDVTYSFQTGQIYGFVNVGLQM